MIDYIKNFKEKKYERFGLAIANICVLNNDKKMAKFYYEKYHKDRNTEVQMNYDKLSKEYLVSNIKTTRKMWHSKSSMKKMPISTIYDS